jgi:hypothetical protein
MRGSEAVMLAHELVNAKMKRDREVVHFQAFTVSEGLRRLERGCGLYDLAGRPSSCPAIR